MFSKTQIEKYFTGEKQESLLFMIIGVSGIITALIFFLFLKMIFYTGAAIPFLVIGLILSIVGYTVYKRSDEDRVRNVYAYDMNPAELRDKELPRMERVMKNFRIYRYTEIFLFLAGVTLYIYFIRDFENDFWRGFGLGLAVMALVALVADYFAEKRAEVYFSGIKSFLSKT